MRERWRGGGVGREYSRQGENEMLHNIFAVSENSTNYLCP